MLPKMLAPSAPPALVERVREIMSAAPVAGIVGALSAMRDRADSTALLADLRGIPTLVMVGSEDRMTPPARASAMASAIPDARLIVISGAGHLPPLEQPSVVTDGLRAFLAGLAQG
jgi:pimeloyl-ACP methyl ester carboxylesterase